MGGYGNRTNICIVPAKGTPTFNLAIGEMEWWDSANQDGAHGSQMEQLLNAGAVDY